MPRTWNVFTRPATRSTPPATRDLNRAAAVGRETPARAAVSARERRPSSSRRATSTLSSASTSRATPATTLSRNLPAVARLSLLCLSHRPRHGRSSRSGEEAPAARHGAAAGPRLRPTRMACTPRRARRYTSIRSARRAGCGHVEGRRRRRPQRKGETSGPGGLSLPGRGWRAAPRPRAGAFGRRRRRRRDRLQPDAGAGPGGRRRDGRPRPSRRGRGRRRRHPAGRPSPGARRRAAVRRAGRRRLRGQRPVRGAPSPGDRRAGVGRPDGCGRARPALRGAGRARPVPLADAAAGQRATGRARPSAASSSP